MLQSCIALVRRPDHRHSILSMAKHIEGSSRRISQHPSYARSTGSGYIGGKGKACINIGNSIYRQKTVESYAYNIWWRLKTFRERSDSDMLQKRRYACLNLVRWCTCMDHRCCRSWSRTRSSHRLRILSGRSKYRKERTAFNMASMQCTYKNDGMTMLKNCIWNPKTWRTI